MVIAVYNVRRKLGRDMWDWVGSDESRFWWKYGCRLALCMLKLDC
jgi:hypothetical protein